MCFHVQGPCGVVREITRCERGVDFVVTVFERVCEVRYNLFFFFLLFAIIGFQGDGQEACGSYSFYHLFLFFFFYSFFICIAVFVSQILFVLIYAGSWDSLGCGYGRVTRIHE